MFTGWDRFNDLEDETTERLMTSMSIESFDREKKRSWQPTKLGSECC